MNGSAVAGGMVVGVRVLEAGDAFDAVDPFRWLVRVDVWFPTATFDGCETNVESGDGVVFGGESAVVAFDQLSVLGFEGLLVFGVVVFECVDEAHHGRDERGDVGWADMFVVFGRLRRFVAGWSVGVEDDFECCDG